MSSKNLLSLSFTGAVMTLLYATPSLARSVYLNGQDVSSARNQNLKKVDLRIDEQGNLFIEAPHYQVNEEKTYIPLRAKPNLPTSRPQHRAPGPLPDQDHTKTDPAQDAATAGADSAPTATSTKPESPATATPPVISQ